MDQTGSCVVKAIIWCGSLEVFEILYKDWYIYKLLVGIFKE